MFYRGAQFSTKEDGEVVENLTQTQLDPSKHRIIPSAGKSLPCPVTEVVDTTVKRSLVLILVLTRGYSQTRDGGSGIHRVLRSLHKNPMLCKPESLVFK